MVVEPVVGGKASAPASVLMDRRAHEPVAGPHRAAVPRVFPLTPTPFESLMLLEHCRRYPMAFVIDVAATGRLDRAALTTALQTALQRHPLLQARLGMRKRRRCWIPALGQLPWVSWSNEGEPLAMPAAGDWNLHEEIGLRVAARQGAGHVTITLAFHHACTDGVGACQFIGDLLAAYGIATGGDEPPPELLPLTPARLRDRTCGWQTMSLTGPSWTQKLRLTAAEIGQCLGDPRVQTLAAPRGGRSGGPAAWPGIESFQFEPDIMDRLRAAAARHDATVNDLLLAALFRTLVRWNRAQGASDTRGSVRILMPIDMRTSLDVDLPAANVTACTFLTRGVQECADADGLVKSIRDETLSIRYGDRGIRFLDTIRTGVQAPALLRLLLGLGRCMMSTAILSNLGDPARRFAVRLPREDGVIVCGGLRIDGMTGAPPLRRWTRTAISVFAHRRLTLGMQCDPRFFGPADTRRLLELYAAHLADHAASATPRVSSRQTVDCGTS